MVGVSFRLASPCSNFALGCLMYLYPTCLGSFLRGRPANLVLWQIDPITFYGLLVENCTPPSPIPTLTPMTTTIRRHLTVLKQQAGRPDLSLDALEPVECHL